MRCLIVIAIDMTPQTKKKYKKFDLEDRINYSILTILFKSIYYYCLKFNSKIKFNTMLTNTSIV